MTGTPLSGQTLTTTAGTWSGTPTSYTHAWLRCDASGGACAAITGATGTSYVLAAADVGATIRSKVTATNAGGSNSATSVQTASVAAPASAADRFGIAPGGNIQNLSSGDLARYLDTLRAAHAKWLRVDINWHVIQYAGSGSYNWTPFDNVVAAASSRGLQVLGAIIYTPPWARPAGTGPTHPPTAVSDLANFARAAATHFSPRGVHAYEIWNEPNISSFWASGPDAARYTAMLKAGSAAIKQVDPSATIVSAGLSPYGAYGDSGAEGVNPITFLQQMYANGARGSFDAVGWHPYSFPYGLAYYGWSAWSQMAATSPSARSVMVANGDGDKKIWLTEFGAPTGSSPRAVSEAAQAELVTNSYAQLKAWPWAGPAFFYSFRDAGTNLADIEHNFGIIRYDWSPKPAYAAYQAAAAAG